MKYAIYLDDVEIEMFYGNEQEALEKYDKYILEYKGEEIYDKIELFAFRTIKEESL